MDDGVAVPLHVARGEPRGAAVVMVPSAFGIGEDVEAQLCDMTAYASVAVAFDPFSRSDPGFTPYENMERIMNRLRALDPRRCNADLRAVIDWARREGDTARVIVVGVCFGATFALRAAADRSVDGLVTWHGTRMENHLARAAEIACPVRHHVGGVDPIVPPEALAKLREAFAQHADTKILVHEGATHGFSHRGAAKAFDANAERAAMESVRELATRG